MSELDRYLEVCQRAAQAGGAVLLDWAGRFAVREKAPADLVTEADEASQETIRKLLLEAFPEHGFRAEEADMRIVGKSALRWIVDPLDGTMNYVHGMPGYAVSIALEHDGKLLVGCVFDPVAELCYTATAGGGAFLNGRRLQVSRATALSQSLVAMSFPARADRHHPSVAQFLNVLERARSTRRLGSCSLNMAMVAGGQLDAYWAGSTKVWDIAAGALLIQEAGGHITALDGGPLQLESGQFVTAATKELHAELIEAIAVA